MLLWVLFGIFKNYSWPDLFFPLLCLLFLLALLWYLTVRVFLDFVARVWREKLSAETRRRESTEIANQVKADFLAEMSHEIRTPLNAIINCTELTLRTELTPELRQYLSTVRTSADWLIHIVNDVLEFSRIEAGTLRLEDSLFSLKDCLDSALKIIQGEADARHLILKARIDPSVPSELRGDSTRLLQVIFNLVENAVKFTTSGGVVVTVESVGSAGRVITLRFSVADTGVGLSEEKVKELFQPLSQVDGAGEPRRKTSAFGLAISKKIIDLMGGSVDVQSHLGAGTTISFTANFETIHVAKPATRPRLAQFIPTQPNVCSATRAISILLADENALSRRLTKSLLESAGHRVEEVSEPSAIPALVEREFFDLLLMDLDATRAGDLEIVRAVRSVERPALRTPIYAFMAPASAGDRDRCRTAGVDGFIGKPVEIDSILNIIAAIALRPIAPPPAPAQPVRKRMRLLTTR